MYTRVYVCLNHIFNFEGAADTAESATALLRVNIDFCKLMGVNIMKKDLLSSELFGNYLAAINVDTHIMDSSKKPPSPSRKG